jgi:hypothetical protein
MTHVQCCQSSSVGIALAVSFLSAILSLYSSLRAERSNPVAQWIASSLRSSQ